MYVFLILIAPMSYIAIARDTLQKRITNTVKSTTYTYQLYNYM